MNCSVFRSCLINLAYEKPNQWTEWPQLSLIKAHSLKECLRRCSCHLHNFHISSLSSANQIDVLNTVMDAQSLFFSLFPSLIATLQLLVREQNNYIINEHNKVIDFWIVNDYAELICSRMFKRETVNWILLGSGPSPTSSQCQVR